MPLFEPYQKGASLTCSLTLRDEISFGIAIRAPLLRSLTVKPSACLAAAPLPSHHVSQSELPNASPEDCRTGSKLRHRQQDSQRERGLFLELEREYWEHSTAREIATAAVIVLSKEPKERRVLNAHHQRSHLDLLLSGPRKRQTTPNARDRHQREKQSRGQ